ncbi:MAG TPA: hypothetical protein VFA10_17840 [Ktedonobacteraceae bacterium]|nr:hypothetical protein [Ktedonobacteraceae bacterium]
MREPGHCTQCNYPIERQRLYRPVQTGIDDLSILAARDEPPVIDTSINYGHIETITYYAHDKEVLTCPGCGGVLLTGDRIADSATMSLVKLEAELKWRYPQ